MNSSCFVMIIIIPCCFILYIFLRLCLFCRLHRFSFVSLLRPFKSFTNTSKFCCQLLFVYFVCQFPNFPFNVFSVLLCFFFWFLLLCQSPSEWISLSISFLWHWVSILFVCLWLLLLLVFCCCFSFQMIYYLSFICKCINEDLFFFLLMYVYVFLRYVCVL